MLLESSIEVGTNLAEIFVDKGYKLVPKQQTLIAVLTDATEGIYEPVDANVVCNANGAAAGFISNHDSYMDNYIVDLIQLATKHVGFARAVVNREVNLFKEEVVTSLSNYKYKDPEDFFNVSYYKLHDIFTSQFITDKLTTYSGAGGKSEPEQFNLLSLKQGDFDLAKFVTIGDEEYDALIQGWVNEVGVSKLLGLVTEEVNQYGLTTVDNLTYTLINYLFYSNLADNGGLNLGFSETQLKTKAAYNRDYYGDRLAVALEYYRRDIRNNVLIANKLTRSFSYYSSEPVDLIVYEETFSKLAEAGGSIEVIFGYLATVTGKEGTVDELVENKERYMQMWLNTRSLYAITLNNNKLDTFKHILKMSFDKILTTAEVSEEVSKYLTTNTGYIEQVRTKANDYINSIDIQGMANLNDISIDLIAKIRYGFTSAYRILREMQNILQLSDTYTPLEAALLAAVKYITDFLVEEIDVVKY